MLAVQIMILSSGWSQAQREPDMQIIEPIPASATLNQDTAAHWAINMEVSTLLGAFMGFHSEDNSRLTLGMKRIQPKWAFRTELSIYPSQYNSFGSQTIEDVNDSIAVLSNRDGHSELFRMDLGYERRKSIGLGHWYWGGDAHVAYIRQFDRITLFDYHVDADSVDFLNAENRSIVSHAAGPGLKAFTGMEVKFLKHWSLIAELALDAGLFIGQNHWINEQNEFEVGGTSVNLRTYPMLDIKIQYHIQ